jgi:hypothetical protein
MAPSEDAKQVRREAEGGSAAAQLTLGWWHRRGEQGLDQNDVKAAAWFRKAADLGLANAQCQLAGCYYTGRGVAQSVAMAVVWGRKAADQGDAAAQGFVGSTYAEGAVGVKKDLPLGKRFLERSAAQGDEDAVALLKELRQCVACGKLDVHHMICSWCRNVRYCGTACQLVHWQSPADSHKPHRGRRRKAAVAGGSSSESAAPGAIADDD